MVYFYYNTQKKVLQEGKKEPYERAQTVLPFICELTTLFCPTFESAFWKGCGGTLFR